MKTQAKTLIVALGIAASSAFAGENNGNAESDDKTCGIVIAMHERMAKEANSKKIPVKQTQQYLSLKDTRGLESYADGLAEYTEGVRTSLSAPLRQLMGYYTLCEGVVSSEAVVSIAPYLGKACNAARAGKEKDCFGKFINAAAEKAGITDQESRAGIEKVKARLAQMR